MPTPTADLPQPDAAEAHVREQLVAQLAELITGSDTLPVMKRGELRGKISTKPGLNRYLRLTPGGLLRIDKARMKAEANLDGKYLLGCSDPHLPAADIALGYEQLLEVEYQLSPKFPAGPNAYSTPSSQVTA